MKRARVAVAQAQLLLKALLGFSAQRYVRATPERVALSRENLGAGRLISHSTGCWLLDHRAAARARVNYHRCGFDHHT